MVVRDHHDRLEVVLGRRRPGSAFVPNMYVFPGGAVDEDDRGPAFLSDVLESSEGDQDGQGIRLANERVTAVRETFEETGLLLAVNADRSWLNAAQHREASAFRADVAASSLPLGQVFQRCSLMLPFERLHVWGRWVTPRGAVRRYDTRFFVCEAPPGQEPVPDGSEMVQCAWWTPQQALRGWEEGTIGLVHPTVKALEGLARFPTARSLFETLAQRGTVPGVLPSPMGAGPRA